ncbi:MAG: hypothetical protein K2K08_06910, partial [Paramuribaculum sp.]|nr:hypothetical protein [Paramuribaculum sp.]
MENQNLNEEKAFEPANDGLSNNGEFGKTIGSALAYFFSMLAFILFVCPFSFWKGAAVRLAKACQNKSLKTFVHTSRWPFFSFLKKMFFEFFIDGMIFISYFIGVLVAIIMFIIGCKEDGFGSGCTLFFGSLIGAYYSPLFLSWIRDLCVLFLLPFQKFLSWVAKPAQQIDVDFHNHTK